MKLRTQMVDGELLAYDRIIDPYAPSVVQVEYLKDDAMAAHALLQAMDEAQAYWDAGDIRNRAAEILAGWLGEDQK